MRDTYAISFVEQTRHIRRERLLSPAWKGAGIMSKEGVSCVGSGKYISSFIRQKEHMSKDAKKCNSLMYLRITEAVGVICLGEGNSQVSEMRLKRFRD